jgi:FixJ family two-component response regulator
VFGNVRLTKIVASQPVERWLEMIDRPPANIRRLERESRWDGDVVAVVDDDSSILRSVGRLLETLGFRPELFGSAEAFMAEAGVVNPACLVSDIHMPGMSGIDLQLQLSRLGVSVPVIFITAHDSEATMRSVSEAGGVACLRKPFSASALLEAVKKAIGRPPNQSTAAGQIQPGSPE